MSQRVLVTGRVHRGTGGSDRRDRCSGMELCEIEPVSFGEALSRAVAEDVELRRLTAIRAGAS
jgi:hypothetical protein